MPVGPAEKSLVGSEGSKLLANKSPAAKPMPAPMSAPFFMALLLNADTRDRIFQLIKQRYPDSDPIEKVLDWTFDLAQTRVVGLETSNALGIPDFGDAEMFALEQMLNGKADAETNAAYTADHPDAGDAITKAITSIRESVIFRPLLSGQNREP